MTERLSSLHDPYNGCVDLQHNYSDNQDWWLFISGIPGLIACQWRVATRNGEQKKTTKKQLKSGREGERKVREHVLLTPASSCFLLLTFLHAVPTIWTPSLCGRRLQGKGKERAMPEGRLPSLLPRAHLTFLSRLESPLPSPSNDGLAGYKMSGKG